MKIIVRKKKKRRRERCHTGKKAMWRWRRRLGPCCHKPRSSRSIQTRGEARIDITPEHLEEAWSCPTPWFWALCLQNYERIHFFFLFILLLLFFICSGFCHTLKWNSHGFTCVPHPDPPSHLPLHPLPLGLPSAPGPSAGLMHPTWAGDLFHPR